MWFIDDPNLLSRERAAITELGQSAEWLVGVNWLLVEGNLCLDAVIRAHEHDYEVRMTYPRLFASVPPVVCPLNANSRWSDHQYGGADGPLCLEWGPDNWHPEVTGAQVLQSAYKLLDIENPLGDDLQEDIRAPSRHRLLIGQEVRANMHRLYVSNALASYLGVMPLGLSGTVKFSLHFASTALRMRAFVHGVQPATDTEEWIDSLVPQSLLGANNDKVQLGTFFVTNLARDEIDGASNQQGLKDLLTRSQHNPEMLVGTKISDEHLPGVMLLDSERNPHFFILFNDGGILNLKTVQSEPSAEYSRMPGTYGDLTTKSVGIIGVGSVGSKVALSLARMGVSHFLLVDYDVFFPENIQRHVLDWSSVAEHKVDALAEALGRINRHIDVEVFRTHLVGQENAGVVSRTLDRLGQCDLLIDATADSRTFNLMAATSKAWNKPSVWMKVFGGGLGGMIARSRPGHDPDPQTMREVFDQYCREHPALELRILTDYAAEDADGQVLTASDADVGIIAHHVARLALDTLCDANDSGYPYSMYLIGLANWWVFDAPFHTIPIATDDFFRSEPESAKVWENEKDNIQFIKTLLR